MGVYVCAWKRSCVCLWLSKIPAVAAATARRTSCHCSVLRVAFATLGAFIEIRVRQFGFSANAVYYESFVAIFRVRAKRRTEKKKKKREREIEREKNEARS